jgi:hypothetical protein
MITNGVTVDPQNPASYDKLPLPRELRNLIREVHGHAGAPRYEARYSGEPTRYERRSVAAPQRSESRFYRPGELDQERLRLKLEVLRRIAVT